MNPLPNPIHYHIYHPGAPLPPARPYAYILAGQGVIKAADTPHFRAALLVSNGTRVAGLPDYPTGLITHLPKIPYGWLRAVLEHARRAGAGQGILAPVEQMYHFHWLGEWRVSVPRQWASAGRVVYRGGMQANIVLEMHSHHEMAAYFSDMDDRDEQGCRLYGVLGRIYSRPELRLRLGIYGDFMEVEPGEWFELGEVRAV